MEHMLKVNYTSALAVLYPSPLMGEGWERVKETLCSSV